MRFFMSLLVVALAGLLLAWFLTAPKEVDASRLNGLAPDLERGEFVFTAAGCASCHTEDGASGDAKLVLSGGKRFASPFGTFLAPNISSDPEHGIGSWSDLDLANALLEGVSPEKQHYYPAFPYTSYGKMQISDVVSLNGYLKTLPASDTPSLPHEVGFPFNIRRSLGGWKLLFASTDWVMSEGLSAEAEQGRYLVEALGHCGECHTPRNPLGGVTRSKWLAGAPNPSGKGKIPNITPGSLEWSANDIAYYLLEGFTPEFDSVGGSMTAVVDNFAKLDDADRRAVAAYLKAIPAHSN